MTNRAAEKMRETYRVTGDKWFLKAAEEIETLQGIIVDLFAPEHFTGCLVNDPHIKPNGPCICGYHERRERFFAAQEKAKAIAAKHDYRANERG